MTIARLNYLPLLLIVLIYGPIEPSWAERTLATLSRREKIGQLFMVATSANPGSLFFLSQSPYRLNKEYCEHLITTYHIGGIIFLGTSSIEQQMPLTRHYQSLSTLPLLIGIDAEWGLNMRLKDGMRFPHAMTLGALQDESLIYKTGYTIGMHCRAMGIHLNYAPVLDVATNPDNPIINYRSFGQDPHAVARKGMLFAQGLHDAGIIACAKHFPGHGDTIKDSHAELPLIAHNKQRLKAVELVPFEHAIKKGIPAIMTAHIALPALDPSGLPASVSPVIIQDILQSTLGFSGLVISDGLGMAGLANRYQKPEDAAFAALCAGNDILLCPTDVPYTVELIENALDSGLLSEDLIDAKVLKILQAKEWAFAHTSEKLGPSESKQLKNDLYRHAITLLKNDNKLIPLASSKPAILSFGCTSHNTMGPLLAQQYPSALVYNTTNHATAQELHNLEEQLASYDTLIIGLFGMSNHSGSLFGIEENVYQWLQKMRTHKKVILALFGSPYSVTLFDQFDTLIMAYEDTLESQDAVAQTISGHHIPTGQLPVSVHEQFPCGAGITP